MLPPVDVDDFPSSLGDPTRFYTRALLEFHHHLPSQLREHRDYFRQHRRGFGEDAFHSMWYWLFRSYRPSSFLEIGVYRGQVISLISLLARLEDRCCQVTGISPFSPAGDSVSDYLADLEFRQDTLGHFAHFHLPEPELVEAYSSDSRALKCITGTEWDMIYIDGNHDYEVVRHDWEICSGSLAPGGLIVLDDSGLSTTFRPPAFATGGHPGPSRLAREIDRRHFAEILQVGHNRVFQSLH